MPGKESEVAQVVTTYQSLHSAVGGDENATTTLTAQTGVHCYGIHVDGSVARCTRVGRNSDRENLCNTRRGVYDAADTIVSNEVGRSALSDFFRREPRALDRSLHELGVILNNGIVLEGVQKNHFAFDDDRVGNRD